MLRNEVMAMSVAHPQAMAVGDGIFRIPCPFDVDGVVHLYYIEAPEPALIDTGVATTPHAQLALALRGVGLDLASVQHILTTHGHWDHMGGHAAMRAIAPHATIHVHPADAYLLDRLEAHTFGYITYMPRALGDAQELASVTSKIAENIVVPVRADNLVLDSNTISLGGGRAVRAVHVPGHSRGSIAFYLEDAKTLFTGDAIQGMGGGPGRLPLVFDDARAYRATVLRVANLAPDRLCLGHAFHGLPGGSGTDPVRQGPVARTFLEESGQAAKAVEEAMRRALANGDPGFIAAARIVLAALADDLGVARDQEGLNRRAIPTLHAFYREQVGAPPPV
jgi:hydroxyacylglutathione hydrolase